jgi:virulence factor Mce-like protein
MPNRGPRINPAIVGVISAAVMFALLFFAFTNVTLFQSTMVMKAQVSSGDTLAPGGDVEVAGVKVGNVKSVEQGSPGALVTMTVDTKKITMYRDASLQVRPHGVFGPKFVEINPGTQQAGNFPDGGTIDIQNTSVSVDFEAILNSLDENTRTSLQTFLYEFGTGSDNRGADFGQTVDSLNVVTYQLTPPLQVIDRRSVEVGRLFENNAVVTETYANSPIYQIIAENNDFLAQLDNHKQDVAGLVVHGNNVLGALDTVTTGNTGNLRTVLVTLPAFSDQLQRFSNDLGYGTNALNPVIMPQRGQAMGDIELAVRRTKDAFGQCDILDPAGPQGSGPTASDTVHANFVKIVPCTTNGVPTTLNGNVAHHHVNVLLGLHLGQVNPLGLVGVCGTLPAAVCDTVNNVLKTVTLPVNLLPAEGEARTICGPNSVNASRTGTAAFGCFNDNGTGAGQGMSNVIPPAGTAPPPLFGQSSAFTSNAQSSRAIMTPPSQLTYSNLLLGN